MIDYLQHLGVTAVELMPVHQFVREHELVTKGLPNYWGYNTIGYFAPHNDYSAAPDDGRQVNEFKTMVKTLHRAGIEILIDVVYNHTAESSEEGPTLCFRGIDNAAYYRLHKDDPRYNVDFSGCGNCLNTRYSQVQTLVMDSLRYWVTEMHVDGFRFDLASVLGREQHEMSRASTFFELVQQDPVVSQVKLIAEPWDVGEGGYQIGNFPPLWTEWNGKYRDGIRDFWRGQHSTLREFATRLTGSSDLYQQYSRRPLASLNFVTCHDGFTLRDLVSYNDKHNEANGENNSDGFWGDNRSWNCGAEGLTDDPAILALRARQQRNFLATLLLSHGVPMLLSGDEMNRTQLGNSNAYNQDNEVSWLDWRMQDDELISFVRELIAVRRADPVFRRRRFLRCLPGADEAVFVRDDNGRDDVAWFTASGCPMGPRVTAGHRCRGPSPRHERYLCPGTRANRAGRRGRSGRGSGPRVTADHRCRGPSPYPYGPQLPGASTYYGGDCSLWCTSQGLITSRYEDRPAPVIRSNILRPMLWHPG
jgi:glycogen operon protein